MHIAIEDATARVEEAADLTRLSVRVADDTDVAAALTGLGRVADDDHVWLDLDTLRARAEAALPPDHDRAAWAEGFDHMVAVAARHGWLDDATTAVRAHIEHP